MKVVMRDGRVLEGSAVEVVEAMQQLAFGVEHLTLPEYVAWVVSNARKFEGAELSPAGSTDAELAGSLVDEMVRAGLATRGETLLES